MKFQERDILNRPGNRYPIVILGEHTFPDGTPGYRLRHVHPQTDDFGTEHWDFADVYLHQQYVDAVFTLLWRSP